MSSALKALVGVTSLEEEPAGEPLLDGTSHEEPAGELFSDEDVLEGVLGEFAHLADEPLGEVSGVTLPDGGLAGVVPKPVGVFVRDRRGVFERDRRVVLSFDADRLEHLKYAQWLWS